MSRFGHWWASRRRRSQGTDESAVIVVMTAISMMMILGFVALSVDMGFWLWQGHREQVAADQASTAAAVFLPDDPAGAAAQALQTARANGFGASTVSTSIGTGQKANQIRVTIRATHPSFFSRVLGRNGQIVSRASTAEWVPPIQMGSPYSTAGNDPEAPPGSQLNYWLSQFGPWAAKHNGDRYGADNCVQDSSVNFPIPYNCTSGAAARGNSPNDYTAVGQYGYRYRVNVGAVVPGRNLVVEAFDPVLANVGNVCTNNLPSVGSLWSLTSWVADAPTRYVSGPGPWCVPDDYNLSGDSSRNNEPTETEFSVLSPARSVSAGTTNPVTPPTGPPAVASPPTTTIGPLGGTSLGGTCLASGSAPGAITVRNDRATPIRLYRLDATCTEVLAATISAGATTSVSVFGGQRIRIYDDRWGGLLTDYTATGSSTVAPNDSFAMHLSVPGPCPTPSAAPSTITVTNFTAGATWDVYSVASDCRETYLGTVAPPPLPFAESGSYPLTVGSRVRVYRNASESLALDETLAGAASNVTVDGTGPGSPCSTATATVGTVTVTNNLDVAVQPFWVDTACMVVKIGSPIAGSGATDTITSWAGHVLRFVHTKTGETVQTLTLTPGAQSVTLTGPLQVGGACSPAPIMPMTLTVINQRSSAVRVAEVDDACIETTRGVVAAAATASYPTVEGWRWRFYDTATSALLGDEPTDPGSATVTLEAPASSTWTGQAAGPPICQRTETSYRLTPYSAADFHTGTISQLVNPNDGVHDNGAGTPDEFAQSFVTGFRQWKRICTIAAADVSAGEYTITVKTNINGNAPGMNSYSLRAKWIDPTGSLPPIDTNLTISAIENLPVFVNLGGASASTIYMTRLHPIYAGRRLRIELFDIGDTASGTVNLKLLPPPDANVGSSWPCEISQVTSLGTFANPTGSDPSTCRLNGLTRTAYNGTSVRFVVAIPDTFTCDRSVPTNCWTKIEMSFSGGQPTDKTTWSATIEGDPLRILK